VLARRSVSFVAPHGAELATAGGRQASESSLAQRADAPGLRRDHLEPRRGRDPRFEPVVADGAPGRTFSQVGGGEPEIPAWFESAARKMLEDRGVGGGTGGMSLAELVLVTAVPATQMAASSKSAAAHGGHPSGGHGKEHKGDDKKPDVNKLAQEVYGVVMKLIESARERSGDPNQ